MARNIWFCATRALFKKQPPLAHQSTNESLFSIFCTLTLNARQSMAKRNFAYAAVAAVYLEVVILPFAYRTTLKVCFIGKLICRRAAMRTHSRICTRKRDVHLELFGCSMRAENVFGQRSLRFSIVPIYYWCGK